ncbi:MAG: CoA transferase [Dehalococcoidia bacterium]
MQNLPLSDLKVLELSQFVSGPYCTKLLAGFGAEVIKIENPDGGDISRRHGPFPDDIPDPEKSGLYLHLNTGKKSITLNWQSRAGYRILGQLIKRSNILVESLGPGVIDHQALQELNPSLIMASISYYGQTGPWHEYQGSDITAQATGGIMNLTGFGDKEPLKIAGPQAEYQAGLNAAVAVMAALLFRDDTGTGQHIDISIMECLASILEGALLSWAYDGTLRQRDGARHPSIYPSTILPCRDGYIHLDASTDWETFAGFMEMPELLQFKPGELRQKADEIDALLTRRLAEEDREEIFHRAQKWRLPFAKVMEVEELAEDEQFQDRDFFTKIEHPATGILTYPGTPFKMSDCRTNLGRAPLLGEHNEEIYGGLLGYAKEELTQLRGMGII